MIGAIGNLVVDRSEERQRTHRRGAEDAELEFSKSLRKISPLGRNDNLVTFAPLRLCGKYSDSFGLRLRRAGPAVKTERKPDRAVGGIDDCVA